MVKTLPIYTYGFDILRKKSRAVKNVDDSIVSLARDMFETMHSANGIGLAAPQIGKDISMAVIDLSQIESEKIPLTLVLINPKIIDEYGLTVMEEGCLSIPLLRAEVERPSQILIEYQDLDLNLYHLELDGLASRVVQHEIDHLNGILFVDHLLREEKANYKDQLKKIKRGEVKVDYLLKEIKS